MCGVHILKEQVHTDLGATSALGNRGNCALGNSVEKSRAILIGLLINLISLLLDNLL